MAKQRVYILNHGNFDLFGYKRLQLPAVVELEEEQIVWLKEVGYKIEPFADSEIPIAASNKPIKSMSVHEFVRKSQNR